MRRHVAVDDLERRPVRALLLVRRVQAQQGVVEHAQDDADVELLVPPPQLPEGDVERGPLDVLHDQEKRLLLDIDRPDDVGVADLSRQPCLIQEHRDELGLARDVRVHDLDRDEAFEAPSAESARQVHDGHAT